MLISENGGANFSYVGMGEQNGVIIPLTTAASSKDGGVVVGGSFGIGYSMDRGATWAPLRGLSEGFTLGAEAPVQTQDAKYNAAAGVWSAAGFFFERPGIALAPSADANFTVVNVPPELLVEPASLRYGAVPELGTMDVTAGDWVDDGGVGGGGDSDSSNFDAASSGNARHPARGRRPFKGVSVGADGRVHRRTAPAAGAA